MATFPSNLCLLVGGYGEEFDPSVERTEMERGPPKMRVLNSRVMAEIQCRLLFASTDDVGEFEEWYFDTINRIGWFTVQHPRTGATIEARIKDGRLGQLTPINNARRKWQRDLTLEYMR